MTANQLQQEGYISNCKITQVRLNYTNDKQKETAEKYIAILSKMGHKVATALEPAGKFWVAENYHQHYYDKKEDTPYCHIYKKIF